MQLFAIVFSAGWVVVRRLDIFYSNTPPFPLLLLHPQTWGLGGRHARLTLAGCGMRLNRAARSEARVENRKEGLYA